MATTVQHPHPRLSGGRPAEAVVLEHLAGIVIGLAREKEHYPVFLRVLTVGISLPFLFPALGSGGPLQFADALLHPADVGVAVLDCP